MSAIGRFGPVTAGISGSHLAAPLVWEELCSDTESDDGSVDTEISIEPARRQVATGGVQGGRVALRHRVVSTPGGGALVEYRLRGGPLLYRVQLPKSLRRGKTSRIGVEFSPWTGAGGRIVSPISYLLTRDGSTFHQVMAKNLIYEIIDPIIWIRLLRRDATLVHASAVVDQDGGAVVIAGAGGVGKSTALLELMSDRRWRYLGDDLVIVDRAGQCWRHPKRLQIYAYNLRHEPTWRKRALSGLSPMGRARWGFRARLLGDKQARQRVPAKSMFGGERVADSGQLKGFLWLTPGAEELTVRPANTQTLAGLAAAAIADELWDFLHLLNLSGLAGATDTLIGDLVMESSRTVESALDGVACGVVGVPRQLAGGLSAVITAFAQGSN